MVFAEQHKNNFYRFIRSSFWTKDYGDEISFMSNGLTIFVSEVENNNKTDWVSVFAKKVVVPKSAVKYTPDLKKCDNQYLSHPRFHLTPIPHTRLYCLTLSFSYNTLGCVSTSDVTSLVRDVVEAFRAGEERFYQLNTMASEGEKEGVKV